MAGVTGLEPAASGVTGRRSNRLSYTPLRAGARPEAILSCMYGLGFAKSRQGPDNSMRSPKGEAWWAVTGSNCRPPGWSSATCANPTLS
jgi:hypothetical protein